MVGTHTTTHTSTKSLSARSDRQLMAATILLGANILGPIGIPSLIVAFVLLRRAQRNGELRRPWAVTIIGAFCLMDSLINFLAWSMELFAHDATVVTTLISGYGRFIDSSYYVDLNSTMLGGNAFTGEKALIIFGVLFMYPIRVVAAWSFLKMRRRGLDQMIWSTYIYAAFWLFYVWNLYSYWPRLEYSDFGLTGWWLCNIVFTSPFIMMPFLWGLNKDWFTTTPDDIPLHHRVMSWFGREPSSITQQRATLNAHH